MKILKIAGLVAFLLSATAFAEDRTPAEWVAQLGADHLADRDKASEALLALGSKAREAVRGALNSPDAEVSARARQLWDTLRWLILPGADLQEEGLVAEAEQNAVKREDWEWFVKKYGAPSILLVAELWISKLAAPGSNEGLVAVLRYAKPAEVARIILNSGTFRPSFEAMLAKVAPADLLVDSGGENLVQIELALGNNRKAFDVGREVFFSQGGEDLPAQCLVAAKRGGFTGELARDARQDVTGETDSDRLGNKFTFYTGLLAAPGGTGEVESLFDLAPTFDVKQVNIGNLSQLIETLFKAGMQARAAKLLAKAASPAELYMRSCAELKLHDQAAADADWKAAMTAVDAAKGGDGEDAIFSMGDIMHDWDDDRAEVVFLKLLKLAGNDPMWGSNACFRLADIAETHKQYARAADYYEKALTLSGDMGIDVDAPGVDEQADPKETVRGWIKKLRAQAAAEKQSPVPPASPSR